jgi:hypothetical protein
MLERIKLVQGDTRPQLILSLTDEMSGAPIDISSATVIMKFRSAGASTLLATLSGNPIAGLLLPDGTVNNAAPYNSVGKGGRCVIGWSSTALNNPAGNYEGEVEITFSDGSVQTVYDLVKFKLRQQF